MKTLKKRTKKMKNFTILKVKELSKIKGGDSIPIDQDID